MLGVNVRRPVPEGPLERPPRSGGGVVVGVLVVLALALITFSFRQPDDGPLASAKAPPRPSCGRSRSPGERVAKPFRDVYGWADSLLTARSDAKRLRAENEALRQAIQNQFAANENAKLKACSRSVTARGSRTTTTASLPP